MPDDHRPNHLIGSASLPPPRRRRSPWRKRLLHAVLNEPRPVGDHVLFGDAQVHPAWDDDPGIIFTHDRMTGRVIADFAGWSTEDVMTILSRGPAATPVDDIEIIDGDDLDDDLDDDDDIPAAEPLPAIPDTPQEREALVAELGTKINTAWGPYKKLLGRVYWHHCQIGEWLSLVQRILGPGRFEAWVKTNCPFSVRTALTYRDDYRKVLTQFKSATLADFTVEGINSAIELYEQQLDAKRSLRSRAKQRREELAERVVRRAATAQALGRTLRLRASQRQKPNPGFADHGVFVTPELQRVARARALEQGLPDPQQVWKEPRDDASAVMYEWRGEDGSVIRFYAWLPDDAHLAAQLRGKSKWQGLAALHYKWFIFITRDEARSHRNQREFAEGKRFEEVEYRIGQLHDFAQRLNDHEYLPRDPQHIEWIERLCLDISPSKIELTDLTPLDPE